MIICYPDVPKRAIETKASVTYQDGFSYRNLITGRRYQYGIATAGASGTIQIQFDLGDGTSSGNVRNLIIGDAKRLIDAGATTFKLDSCSDGIDGTYSNEWTDASISSATLYGTESKDYFQIDLGLSSKRCWRFEMTGGSVTERGFSKLFFGGSVAFSQKPSSYNWEIFSFDSATFISESGDSDIKRTRRSLYRFNISWQGLASIDIYNFQTKVGVNADVDSFYLLTDENHAILNNLRCMHVRLKDFTISRVFNDWYELDTTWEEEF